MIPLSEGLGLEGPTEMLAALKAASTLVGPSEWEILSKSREARIVAARHLAIAALKDSGRFSLAQIGEFFNRDHSSVVHAARAVHYRMRKDPGGSYARFLRLILEKVREVPASVLPSVFRGRRYLGLERLPVYGLPAGKPVREWLRRWSLETELGYLINVNATAAKLAPKGVLEILRLEGGRSRYLLIRLGGK